MGVKSMVELAMMVVNCLVQYPDGDESDGPLPTGSRHSTR